MAYSKKASRYRRRRAYRKRAFKRRRYRRRYYKKRSVRFPKYTEVKCVSKEQVNNVLPKNIATADDPIAFISFQPMTCFIVGGSEGSDPWNVAIDKGTGSQQRIGAKIEPVKFRLSGSIALNFAVYRQDLQQQPPYTQSQFPSFWQVRLIVYQVRGANPKYATYKAGYHPCALCPNTTLGDCDPEEVKKLLATYYGKYETAMPIFTWEEFSRNHALGKVPLRRGIGGQIRVLYNKTFWLSLSKPIKQFRIITKRPKPIVYPELIDGAASQEVYKDPRNAIYCAWIYQPGNYFEINNVQLNLSCQYELYYTDK